MKHVSTSYINVIKNMHDELVIGLRIIGRVTKPFPVSSRLSQRSTLSPYLFSFVITYVAYSGKVLLCMLF